MNKRFEQEYREFIKNSTPDIWDRIEAGTSASERANSAISSDIPTEVLQHNKIERFPKKKGTNYYQIMAIAGAAACFALLAIGSPVVKESMRMEKEAQEGNAAPEGTVDPEKESSFAKIVKNINDNDSGEKTIVSDRAEETPAPAGEKETPVSDEIKASESVAPADKETAQKEQEKTEVKETSGSSAAADLSASTAKNEPSDQGQSVTTQVGSSTAATESTTAKEDKATDTQKKKKKTTSSAVSDVIIGTPVGDTAQIASTGVSGTASGTAASSSSSSLTSSSSSAVTAASSSSSAAVAGASSSAKAESDEVAAAKAQAEAAAAAAEAAKAQAAAAEAAKAQAEAAAAAAEAAKAEADDTSDQAEPKQETVVYSKVTVKVSSVKGSNGEIIYTVKVKDDESGAFKKGKSLKMASTIDLSKGSCYVISFADDGSKTGSKTLYTVLSAEVVSDEEE